MRFVLLLVLVGIFIQPVITFGQFSGDITGSSVSITLDPQFPNPGEAVIASLDDYSINSVGGNITWFVDGVENTTLRNQRTVRVDAPAVGTTRKLVARISFSNRPTVEATKIINPVYLDVIIEPLTYTPIFYAGRALPVHGSLVNITALLSSNTGVLASDNYSYSWQLNDKSIFEGTRMGANRAQITIPYGRTSILTLTVQDKVGTTIARRLISIPNTDVDVQFYEKSTLYGLSHRAIGDTLTLVGGGSTIRAVPYNLDIRAVQGALFSEWRLDGRPANRNASDPFEINLEPGSGGSANVTFKLRNLNELLQGDSASFRVQY